MKILQVTNFFKPSWESGGPARSVYEISKKLVENGQEVTVYTTDGFKSRLDVETNKPVVVDGIRTYYFRNLSSFLTKKTNFPIPYYLPLIVRKEIKNFDIIHINEHRTSLAIVVHYYAKKYGIPYILQPRGSVPTTRKSKQKKIFDLFFGQSIIKDARKIIATSVFESCQYNKYFKLIEGKIVHIPNGINLEMYQSLPEKGHFKEKHSIDSNTKIILFLGRIHEIKGMDILIEAFSELKTILDNIILVIAGPDDGYLDESKLIVNNLNMTKDVMFTGPIYEQDKLEAYVDADVFVLPSKYESFGNVALEACACATPVIVTNNCGISEWIDDEVGCVIEYDKDQLRDSIFKIFTDEELKRRFGEKGMALVREKFGWEPIVKMMEDVYRSCLV